MHQKKYKGFSITYFPMEQQWMVFSSNNEIMSGFMDSCSSCEQYIDNKLV